MRLLSEGLCLASPELRLLEQTMDPQGWGVIHPQPQVSYSVEPVRGQSSLLTESIRAERLSKPSNVTQLLSRGAGI